MTFPLSTIAAPIAAVALCLALPAAQATQFGTVVSSTPVLASVAVPDRQCHDEAVVTQRPSSGAGSLIGAIAGGVLGNNLGGGAGRVLATGIGIVAGAAVGDRIEADGAAPVTSLVQRCRTVSRIETRTTGFDVVYDFQGVRRSVRLAQDPGAQIALDVAVTPIGQAPQGQALAPAQPAYPSYTPYPAEPAPPVAYITPGDAVYQRPAPRVVYAPAPVYLSAPPVVVIGGSAGYYGNYANSGYAPYTGYPGYGGWHGHRR